MDSRLALIGLLKRVLAGDQTAAGELSSVAPDPLALDQIERLAWQRLSQWGDDDDIRAKDDAYAEMRREQIADALSDLEALEAGYVPSEIALGDHIPLLGCLAIVVLAALIYAMFAHGFFMHGDG